jgi:DNA repair protein RadC
MNHAQSQAIADLVYLAARTPPDAARRNPESPDDRVVDDLAALLGEREAEKLRRVNVGALAMMSTAELRKLGLSADAAAALRAAFRLAIKAANEAPLPAAKIVGPATVDDLMRDRVALLPHEEVWALFLSKGNAVKADLLISKSGFDFAAVDTRLIFHGALEVRAAGFILVHNHPSGMTAPSQADKQLTRQLADQGRVMLTPLVDHVIIARGGYASLQQEGLI